MSTTESENPIYGPFFGVMGAASSIIFSGKRDFPAFLVAAYDIDRPCDNFGLCTKTAQYRTILSLLCFKSRYNSKLYVFRYLFYA